MPDSIYPLPASAAKLREPKDEESFFPSYPIVESRDDPRDPASVIARQSFTECAGQWISLVGPANTFY